MGKRKSNSGQFKKGVRSSLKTEFKKGQKPWNKGKKGVMPNPWINKGRWFAGFKADDHIVGKKYAKAQWAKDKKITLALEEMGFKVLRFWDNELTLYPEKCFHEIIKALKESRKQNST